MFRARQQVSFSIRRLYSTTNTKEYIFLKPWNQLLIPRKKCKHHGASWCCCGGRCFTRGGLIWLILSFSSVWCILIKRKKLDWTRFGLIYCTFWLWYISPTACRPLAHSVERPVAGCHRPPRWNPVQTSDQSQNTIASRTEYLWREKKKKRRRVAY